MALTEKDIALIEGRLRGKLTGSEDVFFAGRMQDSDFSKEYSYYEQLHNVQILEGRNDLRKTFEGWDEKKVQPRRLAAFAIAAAIAVLMIYSVPFLTGLFRPSNERLFSEYFDDYPNLVDPIVKGDQADAFSPSQFYEMENYQSAIARVASEPDHNFYQALSFIALDSISRATEILEKYMNTSAPRFLPSAQWYLALCYLHEGKMAKCQLLLQDIIDDPTHDFREDARELLKKL